MFSLLTIQVSSTRLIQFPNGDRKYIFHLSNDTNHDSVMTTRILKDIIMHYPELLENGALVLRSDNSSTQYKSHFVFYNMIQFSKELNVPIYWFYGEPGHGCGLIDAMGWFGCKGPLRKAIIQADKWFPTALPMTEFLTTIFIDESTKFYHYVNDESTAILRKNNERKDHPLPGCMAAHLITFKPDGSAKLTLSLKHLDSSFNTDEFEFDARDLENNNDDESVCDIVYDVEKLDLIDQFLCCNQSSLI